MKGAQMGIKHDTRELTKKKAVDHKRPLLNSFKYATRGIIQVFRSERSFRLQLVIFAVTVIAGLIFSISGTEWVFILAAGGVVLVCEMINTAIEYVTDLVTEEYRILAKHIKNISAGAVLVSSVIAVVIGLIIFIPYFLEFF
jgi:undecaprenol kinase